MREFQRKQKIRKRMYSKTALFFMCLLIFFISRGVYGIYQKEKASRLEVERVSKQKAEIEARLAFVSKSADLLSTQHGIETEIRNKFDVVKPGEEVIVVVDKEIPPAPEEKKNFLEKFWGGVTGVFKKDQKNPDADEVRVSPEASTEQ